MEYKCPYCGKELTGDDVIRGNCPFCKKLVELKSVIVENVEKEPEEKQKVEEIQNPKHSQSGETNTFATLSIVFGVLGFLILPLVGGILAIIFGKKAKTEIKNNPNYKGEEIAKVGIILGKISLVIYSIILVLIIITALFFIIKQMTKKPATITMPPAMEGLVAPEAPEEYPSYPVPEFGF